MGIAEPKMYMPMERQAKLYGTLDELGRLLGCQETADLMFIRLLKMTRSELSELRSTLAEVMANKSSLL